jgi:hypothetical protein
MIECIFTLDYEIFGDGTGALQDLVYEPTQRLVEIFRRHDARFVVFVEAAELEKIEAFGTDGAIGRVQQQVRDLYHEGFEIGLHLHPQWCNAKFIKGSWILDYDEYNLCILPRTRIAEIVRTALDYLRYVVDDKQFSPLSFRAGNWLFQPTKDAASVLLENGIRVDSSVFKGGLQHHYNLDYRQSLHHPHFWRFKDDVTHPDPFGPWIELPIHTEMVPIWKMRTSIRLKQTRSIGLGRGNASQKLSRLRDFLRFRYPLKFDFCRMTQEELTSMLRRVIDEDRRTPDKYRPIVAIGHTKDLPDFSSIDAFLKLLESQHISLTTFNAVHSKGLLK